MAIGLVMLAVVGLAVAWFQASAVPSWPDPATGWSQRVVLKGARDKLAWSPDGRTLATNSATHWTNSKIIIWDVATGSRRQTLPPHSAPVIPAWSPDGRTLAVASRDGTAGIWRGEPLTERAILTAGSEIMSVAWSHDGKYLATGSGDGSGAIWDAETGNRLARIGKHSRRVVNLAWNPRDAVLALASEDATVSLWRVPGGEPLAELRGHTGSVYGLAWSPDGGTLASSCFGGRVLLWDQGATEPRATAGHRSPVVQLAWNPRGTLLATSSTDPSGFWRGAVPSRYLGPPAEAILWDPAGRASATLGRHPNTIDCLAWNPEGDTLATASSPGLVILWDPLSGAPRGSLRGPGVVVEGLAWSPDGRTLACSYYLGELILWGRSP